MQCAFLASLSFSPVLRFYSLKPGLNNTEVVCRLIELNSRILNTWRT